MSMSTHAVGIKPPDAKWERMKAAYDACHLAGVPIPEEVEDFFDGDAPDPAGVVVEIEESDAVAEWADDHRSGFEVDLSKLPKDVTVIRFYNSW